MSRGVNRRGRPLEEVRADMIKRLRGRQSEIEAAIFDRVRAVPGSVRSEDAENRVGLRAAVAAVVDYSLTGIEQGEECSGPIPSAAIAQARRGARNGVSLDTIVLRYISGHRLFGKFVMDEADHSGLSSYASVQRQLRSTQEALLEGLITAIAHEHKQERERVAGTADQRRKELVQRLLDGEPLDTSDLDYELDSWHLGLIAVGAKPEKAVQSLADGLGRQLLLVPSSEKTVWAWLGGHRKLMITDAERLLSPKGAACISLAIGEPGRGIDGWRQTHQEAQAALLVALHTAARGTGQVVGCELSIAAR
jgi:hypothetical protein